MGKIQSKFNITIENRLVEKAQTGDMSAHEKIFNLFSPAVYHMALSTLKHQQAAEDLLQNTFLIVIRKIHQFRFDSPFGMWLRSVTVNQILMQVRKQKTTKQTVSLSDHEDSNIIALQAHQTVKTLDNQSDTVLDLQRLLGKLPLQTRTILWLKEVEGYTHQEIGALMNKSTSYSKSLVSRAYEVLQNRYLYRLPKKLKEKN